MIRLYDGIKKGPFEIKVTHRPWGFFKCFAENKKCTVKVLYIQQNEQISLQRHKKRDQMYVALEEGFKYKYEHPDLAGNEQPTMISKYLKVGEVVGHRKQELHRLGYTGPNEYGKILELSFGPNDENDIERIEDNYERADV